MPKRTIKLGEGARASAVKVTIELRETPNGTELSICSAIIKRHRDFIGGQLRRGILKYLDIYEPGVTPGALDRLFEIWDRWHLNGMRAECAHQRSRGETWRTHLNAECPDCGYKLGHAWLFEPLPNDVLATVRRWIDTGVLDVTLDESFRAHMLKGGHSKYGIANND